MSSKLSGKQIQAYKLCSGEHEGLSTKEVAMKMSISSRTVNRLLEQAEKICPMLFPLLSVQEARMKTMLTIGHNNYDLANRLGVNLSRVSQIINSLYAKRPGMITQSQPIKMVRYAPHLDNQIREKF